MPPGRLWDALTSPPRSHPGPPQLCLHRLALPLQQVDVPPAAAHLQAEHGAAVVHAPLYLRHGRLGQDLHDGQHLALEAALLHHAASPANRKRNDSARAWLSLTSGMNAHKQLVTRFQSALLETGRVAACFTHRCGPRGRCLSCPFFVYEPHSVFWNSRTETRLHLWNEHELRGVCLCLTLSSTRRDARGRKTKPRVTLITVNVSLHAHCMMSDFTVCGGN